MASDAPEAEKQSARGPGFRRLAKIAGVVVAGVGIVSAGIGYVTQGVEFFTQVTDYFQDRSEVRAQLAIADERLSRADYQTAWTANAKAIELAPRNSEVSGQQARIAMKWLEDARVSSAGGPKNFAELVDPLKAALLERLPDAQGSEKADLQAHIGWANFLRSRDGLPATDIIEEFDAAIAQDPNNSYGHAMRGFWLLWNGGPIDKARPDLDWSLTHSSDPAFSDGLIMAGLTNNQSDVFMVAAIQFADAIRKTGRAIDDRTRSRLLWYYTIALHEKNLVDMIGRTVPAAEQGVFLDWLRQGEISPRDKRVASYFMAYFAESDGKRDDALKLYGDLVATSPGNGEDVTTLAQSALTRLRKR